MKHHPINKQLMTLDKEEKELLDSVEKDEWISNYESSVEFEIRKTKIMKAAQDALNINKGVEQIEITIHLPKNIYNKIMISAEKSGIDYENWITDTLQKMVG
jgi:predicted DNA binding CopG/RHH family protein